MSKNGYLMLELMVGLAIFSVCSLLVAQWYAQILHEEKNTLILVQEVLEIASVMNQIKARVLPLQGTRGTFGWASKSFGAGLSGHWVTLAVHDKILIFGVT